MSELKYDFQNNDFVTYEAVPKVEIISPFTGKTIDNITSLSNGFYPDGTPRFKQVAKSVTQPEPTTIDNGQPVVRTIPFEQQFPEYTSRRGTQNPVLGSNMRGRQHLIDVMNEVSRESGYEGLSDQLVQSLLLAQSARESNYRSVPTQLEGSASGYFQMIDRTRQALGNTQSREQFMRDDKEQVRCAYKLYRNIMNMPQSRQLLNRGYNIYQVLALGWWYPKAMDDVLNNKFDRSLGGYSTKKALTQYKNYG